MEIICVMLGGALGSTTRYKLGKWFSKRQMRIPYTILLINIVGSFLLGIVSSFDLSQFLPGIFLESFLTAYALFSTFMFENFVLLQNNRILSAFIYFVSTLALSVATYYGGFFIVTLLLV